MAKAIPTNRTKTKWNVVSSNGVIEHRGVSEIEAKKLAADLTRIELTRKLKQRSREKK